MRPCCGRLYGAATRRSVANVTKMQKILQHTHLPLARELLARSAPTSSVGATTRERLLAESSIQRHPADRVLSRRDEPVTELLLILDGSLEVSTRDRDGRRSICWYLATGQWMGLIPLIDGRGAIHDLRSHTSCVLLHIPRTAFSCALHDDPQLALACLNLLCERSRALYALQAAEALLSLRGRLAGLLLALAARHGRDGERGLELTLRLSQDELADMLGITRQSLNRELKTLERQSLISIARARITLQDLTGLRRLAGSDVQVLQVD